MLKIDLNRLDGRGAAKRLQLDSFRISGDEALAEIMIAIDHSIEFYLPAPQGNIDKRLIESAKDVLVHLGQMDNAVQNSCAEECARSGYHSRNYESWLAYATLVSSDDVVLHYDGAVVNTEWDERFSRVNGVWTAAKDAEDKKSRESNWDKRGQESK